MVAQSGERSPADAPDRPVFIVGDARSGTTLAYLILTACPAFARYRAETHLLDVAPIVYGDIGANRRFRRFVKEWVESKQFARSKLTEEQLNEAWSNAPRRYSALLGRFMQAIAIDQGVPRWVEKTPAHVHELDDLSAEFPDARFLHMIRDPRDVALSRQKLGWVANVGSTKAQLVATCLEWETMIRRARASAAKLGNRYREFKYEDLVTDPTGTFARMCEFVEIEAFEPALAELSRSNTAFDDPAAGTSAPQATESAAGRWRTRLDEKVMRAVEWAVGDTLQMLGYPTAFPGAELRTPPGARLMISWLSLRASARRWIKHRSPLRVLSRASLDPVDDDGDPEEIA